MVAQEEQRRPAALSLDMSGAAAAAAEASPSRQGSAEEEELLKGWRVSDGDLSLPEVHHTTLLPLLTNPHPERAWSDVQLDMQGTLWCASHQASTLHSFGDLHVCPRSRAVLQVHGSVRVPGAGSAWYAKAAAFAGLGGMIAVGYMDPGNWWVLHACFLPGALPAAGACIS